MDEYQTNDYDDLTTWTKVLEYSLLVFLAVFIMAVWLLIPPILRPQIISYPWRLPESHSYRERDKKRTVVMAGSFNPPHRGHLAMLEYLSKRYGQVIVVIGVNPNKTYLVSPIQRVELLRKMLDAKKLSRNVRVEVYRGYIWRYAKRQKASIFFRGIRTWERDGAEERNLQILNTWGPLLLGPLYWPLPTIYLEGNPDLNHISSTLIRDISKKTAAATTAEPTSSIEQALKDLIPAEVAREVADLYSRETKKDS